MKPTAFGLWATGNALMIGGTLAGSAVSAFTKTDHLTPALQEISASIEGHLVPKIEPGPK